MGGHARRAGVEQRWEAFLLQPHYFWGCPWDPVGPVSISERKPVSFKQLKNEEVLSSALFLWNWEPGRAFALCLRVKPHPVTAPSGSIWSRLSAACKSAPAPRDCRGDLFRRDHRRSRPELGLQGWSRALHTQVPRSPWRHTPGLSQATSALHCPCHLGLSPQRAENVKFLSCGSPLGLFPKILPEQDPDPRDFNKNKFTLAPPPPVRPAPEGKQKRKRGPGP